MYFICIFFTVNEERVKGCPTRGCAVADVAADSSWLSPNPSPCPAAKSRSIALPMDLDAHVSSLLNSSSTSTVQRNTSSYKTATRTFPRVSTTPNQWDYKNIIEKLQVWGCVTAGRCGHCKVPVPCFCLHGMR